MKLPNGSGLHSGARTEAERERINADYAREIDERKRARMRDTAETVSWALKKGELNGLKRALEIVVDLMRNANLSQVGFRARRRYGDAIAKLEAELDPGRTPEAKP